VKLKLIAELRNHSLYGRQASIYGLLHLAVHVFRHLGELIARQKTAYAEIRMYLLPGFERSY
jgi:hypothetical protein